MNRLRSVELTRGTMSEVVANILGYNATFDVLPQHIFDKFCVAGFNPWGQMVTLYLPHHDIARHGITMPVTLEALEVCKESDVWYWYDGDVRNNE